MATSTVNLSFRYSEGDYVRAMRAHYASKLRLRLDLIVLVMSGIAGVYLWRLPGLRWLSIAALALCGIFCLMLIAAFIIIPPLAFRREPKFRDEYSLKFSEDGIHFNTTHIDSRLQWSMYSSALVDSYSYVLYYGERSFTIVPKRVSQDQEQLRSFERLLEQHVPKIITKP